MKRVYLCAAVLLLAMAMMAPATGLAEMPAAEGAPAARSGEETLDFDGEGSEARKSALEEVGGLDLGTGLTGEGVALETIFDANAADVALDNLAEANSEGIPASLSLGVGETYALKVENAKYTSSKKSVATVSKRGVIRAKKKGKADITVRSGKKTLGVCRVTVLAAPKSVKLSDSKLTLSVNQTYPLTATLPKRTASRIRWISSREDVATVDENGVVTAVGKGTATITARTFNGCKATCSVTVKNPAGPVLTDYPTRYSHSVHSEGHYVNWAGVSSVSQFRDRKGHFCFAVDEGDRVVIYRAVNGKVRKVMTVSNPYDRFGGAVCDKKGYYYLVWGRVNETDDTSVKTILVSKYTSKGKRVASAGGNGSEGMPDYYDEGFYTSKPFDGGNCDVAISGKLLLVNYARGMYSGHQANTLLAVNTSTMKVVTGMTTYNSHSFDQRVTPYAKTGGFLLESQGDCFPRGFSTVVTDAKGNLNEMLTFNFWVQKNAYSDYDMWKLNATRARLGNILETKKGAALVAASVRSLSKKALSEPYDVFVQVFNPQGSADKAGSYVTSGVRSGRAGNNGDRRVKDYGVCWLTDLKGTGKTVEVVQAVSAGDDTIAVLYELYEDGGFDSTWCMVLNGDGSVRQPAFDLGGVRLNVDEDPVYADGAVQWISNEAGSDRLVLHSLALAK